MKVFERCRFSPVRLLPLLAGGLLVLAGCSAGTSRESSAESPTAPVPTSPAGDMSSDSAGEPAAPPAPPTMAAEAPSPGAVETPPPAPPAAPRPLPSESIIINWQTDLDAARGQANITGKDLLVVFFGNETYPWSRRLEFEILNQPAFAVIANKHFVFVRMDFSRHYARSQAQLEKNTALGESWDIRTFPTVVLADRDGRPYAVTGYRNVGAADYARHLEGLRGIREQRDHYLAAAQEAGGTRPILLAQALRTMDEEVVLRHYADELEQLKELDPENFTGLGGDLAFVPKFNALRMRVGGLILEERDYAGALKAVDDFIAAEHPLREHLQKTLFLKLSVHGSGAVHDHAAVIGLMDEIIAINPVSEQGMTAVDVRARALALLAEERRAAAQQQ